MNEQTTDTAADVTERVTLKRDILTVIGVTIASFIFVTGVLILGLRIVDRHTASTLPNTASTLPNSYDIPQNARSGPLLNDIREFVAFDGTVCTRDKPASFPLHCRRGK